MILGPAVLGLFGVCPLLAGPPVAPGAPAAPVAPGAPGTSAARVPHPGPPVWGDLTVRDAEVLFELQGEPEPLRECLDLDATLLGPLDDASRADVEGYLAEYFREHNPLAVNGQRVEPTLRSLEIPEDTLDQDGWLVVKIELVYPCEEIPRRVSIIWENFDGAEWMGEQYIPVIVNQNDLFSLYPDEPEFTWHAAGAPAPGLARPLPRELVEGAPRATLPAASLLLSLVGVALGWLGWSGRLRRTPAVLGAAAALLTGGLYWNGAQPRLPAPWRRGVTVPAPEQALKLFETLQRNVYAAFDADSESEIYELLAVSVSAELLDDLYGEIFESLVLREDGGAVCRIEEIEVLESDADFHPAAGDGRGGAAQARFDVDWHWRVHGKVAHWGHIHKRINEYRALYSVEHDGRSWKIAAVDVKDHARVEDDG